MSRSIYVPRRWARNQRRLLHVGLLILSTNAWHWGGSPSRGEETPTASVPPLPTDRWNDEQRGEPRASSDSRNSQPPFEAAEELTPGLTIAELEERALSQHPAVMRDQARVTAARGEHWQVGLGPNPTVGYIGQQIGSQGLAEQDGVVVGQEIVRGGKLRLNRQVAAREVQKAQQELTATIWRVRTDVRQAGYEVLAAQRTLEVAEELSQIAREGLQSAQALLQAKEVGRPDVLLAEVEVENAALAEQNAMARWEAAWQSLASVVGEPDLAPTLLEGDLESPPREIQREGAIDDLLTHSPEIAQAIAEVERTHWALARACAEPRPNVTVEGVINARDNGIGGRSDGGLQVSVPVPLWNRNQGAILKARAEWTAAQQSLARLELDLRQRFAKVYERYANGAAQVSRYRERVLPAAQESLELTRKSYLAGEIGFVDLLTAQRTYFQTSMNYLTALRELRLAETEIDGFLLSDSLSAR